uniref:DUF1361 domain-containing protein n=1 Tax=Cyanothece sp. (strain PCC 7425 / ATCC 29141) TaxID=395961 RepID=B8HVT1_CYAP4
MMLPGMSDLQSLILAVLMDAQPEFSVGKNLFLALIPLGLSYSLFQLKLQRGVFWWLGAIAFLLFLPNAAYVLTDVIHLIAAIRVEQNLSFGQLVLGLIPLYLVYMLVGFEAYVLSLTNLEVYLRGTLLQRYILPIEILINVLVAIGIYMGRFQRLNSWYILTRPQTLLDKTLQDLTRPLPLEVIAIIFVVLTLLYFIFKFLNSAVIYMWQNKYAKD